MVQKRDKVEYNMRVINAIKKVLIDKQQTVSVAESVTSGHIQVGLSLAIDAMQFFQGGITTYNLGQKARHFHVDPIHAFNCNCVSEKVAIDMARGVEKMFSSKWGIAITGYATPDPEHDVKDPFAFYAFTCDDAIIKTGKITVEKSQQKTAQIFYANQLYKLFLDTLRTN